jgi:uncharacterized membrane protein
MGSKIFKALPLLPLAVLSFVHVVFAYKEIFDWERSAVEVIGMTPEAARASIIVGKNQGLSNAFLAAGASWALALWWLRSPSAGRPWATFFAAYALIAGVFGWITFEKNGFLTKQALPGLAVLAVVWFPYLFSDKPLRSTKGHSTDRDASPDIRSIQVNRNTYENMPGLLSFPEKYVQLRQRFIDDFYFEGRVVTAVAPGAVGDEATFGDQTITPA